MKVAKLAGFTAYGTASGFVVSGLGGAILHAAHHTRVGDAVDDAIVGAAGGAAVNFVAGTIAALSPHISFRHDLADLATSTLAVGALGGLVGAYLLGEGVGEGRHRRLEHEFWAGAVGTLVSIGVGVAAWSGLCMCRLALCCCPRPERGVAQVQAWLRPGYRPVTTEELADEA